MTSGLSRRYLRTLGALCRSYSIRSPLVIASSGKNILSRCDNWTAVSPTGSPDFCVTWPPKGHRRLPTRPLPRDLLLTLSSHRRYAGMRGAGLCDRATSHAEQPLERTPIVVGGGGR